MSRTRLSLVLIAASLLVAACDQSEPAAEPAGSTTAAPEIAAVPAIMPADAPPQEQVPAGSDQSPPCRSTLGAAASARLVERCIAVSPATRPPCHADNPCALIQDEIDRACAQYGLDEAKPAECEA
ncbi:MAG: hypothetical protein K2X25_06720 [Caulobacteraceae bacterium]|nr:hypothetical protein [Caulobacteraceae bacterium]